MPLNEESANLALEMLAADGRARSDYIDQHGGDPTREQLKQMGALAAEEAMDLLGAAEIETPKFLNGVLLSNRQYDQLMTVLETIDFKLKLGAKYEHDAWTQHNASWAGIANALKTVADRARHDGDLDGKA